MVLRPITEYVWDLNDGKLTVIWDTQMNMQAIRDRVNLLLRGCKCVTGCSQGGVAAREANAIVMKDLNVLIVQTLS